jgi:hypothetical protein
VASLVALRDFRPRELPGRTAGGPSCLRGRNREVPGDTPLAALLMIAPPELQTGTELKVQHHITQASEFNIQYSTSRVEVQELSLVLRTSTIRTVAHRERSSASVQIFGFRKANMYNCITAGSLHDYWGSLQGCPKLMICGRVEQKK